MVKAVAIYCDAATLADIERAGSDPQIAGATTNPSLMRKAGITNYRQFAKEALKAVAGKPISFEVLADDWAEMESQAIEISSWGPNVWVKIPVTNTKGESSRLLIERISSLNLNITAVMTRGQMDWLREMLQPNHIMSVFVGRITDTWAQAPIPSPRRECKVLWASARSVDSVRHAHALGYDIITLTPDLIAKLLLRGKDLTEYSLETVQQFYSHGKGIEF